MEALYELLAALRAAASSLTTEVNRVDSRQNRCLSNHLGP
jgi:hypothetical protein